MSDESMTRPALPPCPVCGADVEQLVGFGARTHVEPCGHAVLAEFNAGGVRGVIIFRKPESREEWRP